MIKLTTISPTAILLALIGTTAPTAEAQALPQQALHATLEYFHADAAVQNKRLMVETAGFPDEAAVASAALGLGIRAGSGSTVKDCNAETRRCTLVGADRLLNLYDFTVTKPGREIELRVILSRMIDVEVEGEEIQRTTFAFRRITLRNDGGWRVIGDDPLVIG